MADALCQRVKAQAQSLGLAGASLAVGYSGGLDSTVLLHLFSRLRADLPFVLQAIHVHHGLSPNADEWLRHCEAVCRLWQVPLSHRHLALDPEAPDSLEARAREQRYAAYAELDCQCLLLGHHQDDQAETLIYRLARGAGVHGASAMPSQRLLGRQTRILRPLLTESRQTLLAYAQHYQLAWVDDESNGSLVFDRNWIRHAVLAPLRERFPHAPASLARAAAHFADAAQLLDELAALDAAGDVAVPLQRLPLARLAPLTPARRHNLLRWFLATQAVRPDAAGLAALSDLLLTAPKDAQPCLRLGERYVRRFRGAVWVSGMPAAPVPVTVIPGEDAYLPEWRGRLCWRRVVDAAASDAVSPLQLRPRAGGERLRLHRGGPSRLVKHLYQEADIPPWLRDAWPLVWSGEQLLAVAGLPMSDPQLLGGWQPVWLPDDWSDCSLDGSWPAG